MLWLWWIWTWIEFTATQRRQGERERVERESWLWRLPLLRLHSRRSDRSSKTGSEALFAWTDDRPPKMTLNQPPLPSVSLPLSLSLPLDTMFSLLLFFRRFCSCHKSFTTLSFLKSLSWSQISISANFPTCFHEFHVFSWIHFSVCVSDLSFSDWIKTSTVHLFICEVDTFFYSYLSVSLSSVFILMHELFIICLEIFLPSSCHEKISESPHYLSLPAKSLSVATAICFSIIFSIKVFLSTRPSISVVFPCFFM